MTAAPALTLHLHGAARVVGASGQAWALGAQAAALCALAALAPGTPRERAALWLWPASADPRRNLRQQLLRLRQQVGQSVIGGDKHLALAAGVVLAGADADGGGLLLAAHVAWPGVGDNPGDDPGHDPFSAWLQAQRQAQAARRQHAAQQALASAEAAGALDDALHLAQHGVHCDADSEASWHALMRVHCLRGEPAAGLQAFAQWQQRLARQGSGHAPSAAMAALAAALRQGLLPVAAAARAALLLPATLKRPPRLAGRSDAWAAAQQAWGQGQVVLLEGEAGMGKSRLIAELVAASAAQRQHHAALAGSGRPGDAGVPYATLARWLAPLLAAGAGALAPQQRLALAHLQPGKASDAVSPAALQPGGLGAAVAALLQQQALHSLVLDDLHFADAATLDLVATLATPAATAMAAPCWLLAMRPAEAGTAALALRDGLAELQRLVVVTLAPLDVPAAAALVDSLALPGLSSATLAPALVRHTGGNPLYLLETLKQGLVDGSLGRGALPRPAQVGELISRRLQRLSAAALTVARVAAIAGVDFCIELAEAATGTPAVQLASAWQELQDAQVLRDEAFAHDLVADAALRSVPPVVARRVHVQCAQWLAAQGVEPARLAWHWHHGGRPAEAGAAFVAAAQRAEQAARLQEEAALYAHAAAAFAEAGLAERRFDALVCRVRSLNGADFGDQALQECRALADAAGPDNQRLQALSELCGLLAERSESAAALDVGHRALALARQLGDAAWQLRTVCHMATAACRLGQADTALALLAPLQAVAQAQTHPGLRLLWHGEWGATLGHAGRLREAVAAYDAALADARSAGLQDAEGRLLLNCAVSLRQAGQFDRALALSRQGQALASADGDDGTPINRLLLARDEAEAGLYGAALPTLEALLPTFAQRGAGFWLQATRQVLARLWLDLGQYARALAQLAQPVAAPADALPAWLRADRCLLRLDAALALGQPAPAGLLDEAGAWAAADAQRGPLLQVRLLRHQRPAAVLAAAAPLAEALRAKERGGALMALQVHLARAALASAQPAMAGEAAMAVMALFEAGNAPDAMHRAEAWWVAHQALAAAGRSAAAEAALRQGERWLRGVALPQVPPPFLDSFLHRQAVNRALLAAAGQR